MGRRGEEPCSLLLLQKQLPRTLLFFLVMFEPAAPQTLPGCLSKCGKTDIPYPFGIGNNCSNPNPDTSIPRFPPSYNPIFNMSCTNETLYLAGIVTKLKVSNISLSPPQVVVDVPIFHSCSKEGNSSTAKGDFSLSSGYVLNVDRNMFMAVGCEIIADFTYRNGKFSVTSGCMSRCDSLTTDAPDDCIGIGCCQTIIPDGIFYYIPGITPYETHDRFRNSSPCSYAFVADRENFRFKKTMLSDGSLSANATVPVVLDWHFGVNTSCEESKRLTTYACSSKNSECSNRHKGYVCSCSKGYQGNPYLHNGCHKCATLSLGVGIGIGSGLAILFLFGSMTWLYKILKRGRMSKLRRRYFKKNHNLLFQQTLTLSTEIHTERIKFFSMKELKKATNNFDSTRVIGRGGHGLVYKGLLLDQRVVAIKKSKITHQTEITQFINEVLLLSQINHRNVVKLLGCCLETDVPLLVYEFISNGTLFHHLHTPKCAPSLTWNDRLRIATEVAGALAYLHSAISMPIFHRDLKTSNILLDDYLTVKISDFGASKFKPLDQTHITTAIQGTFGYLDPEYMHTGKLTEKSDVYSLGVILVELLTGISPCSRIRCEEDGFLISNFLSAWRENRLEDILDAVVKETGDQEEINVVSRLAKNCLKLKGQERPSMKEIEMILVTLRRPEKQHCSSKHHELSDRLMKLPSATSTTENMTRQFSLEMQYFLSQDFPR